MAVLRKAEDQEVRGVLLQLVQALRYEPGDDSRLAAFLVQRAARQPTIAIPLHWCAGGGVSPPTVEAMQCSMPFSPTRTTGTSFAHCVFSVDEHSLVCALVSGLAPQVPVCGVGRPGLWGARGGGAQAADDGAGGGRGRARRGRARGHLRADGAHGTAAPPQQRAAGAGCALPQN